MRKKRRLSMLLSLCVIAACMLVVSGLTARAAEEYTTWQLAWDFTLDNQAKTINLKGYEGVWKADGSGAMVYEIEKDIVIPAKAVIGGVSYDTIFESFKPQSFYAVGGKEKYQAIETITFEKGVKASNPLYYAFSELEKLKKVTFNGLDLSACISTSMTGTFKGCSSLEQVDIETLNTSNITDMSEMFKGCYSLGEIQFDSLDTSKVTYMRSIFAECGNITIDMRKNIVSDSLSGIFDGGFSGVLFLPNLTVSLVDGERISLDFLEDLKGKAKIHFSGTRAQWDIIYGSQSDNPQIVRNNITIYFDGDGTWAKGTPSKGVGYHFKSDGLKYVITGKAGGDGDTIEYEIECTGPVNKNITNIRIDLYKKNKNGMIVDDEGNCYSLEDGEITIGWHAFKNCSKLRSIYINGNVTIEAGAFKNCKKLTSLQIVGNMDFGVKAFYKCKKLNSMILLPTGSGVYVEADSFDGIAKGVNLATNKKDKNILKKLKSGGAVIKRVKYKK